MLVVCVACLCLLWLWVLFRVVNVRCSRQVIATLCLPVPFPLAVPLPLPLPSGCTCQCLVSALRVQRASSSAPTTATRRRTCVCTRRTINVHRKFGRLRTPPTSRVRRIGQSSSRTPRQACADALLVIQSIIQLHTPAVPGSRAASQEAPPAILTAGTAWTKAEPSGTARCRRWAAPGLLRQHRQHRRQQPSNRGKPQPLGVTCASPPPWLASLAVVGSTPGTPAPLGHERGARARRCLLWHRFHASPTIVTVAKPRLLHTAPRQHLQKRESHSGLTCPSAPSA